MASTTSNSPENENSLDDIDMPMPSTNSQDSQDDSQDEVPDEFAPCSTDAGHTRFTRGIREAEAAAKKKAEEAARKDKYCPKCDIYMSNAEMINHFNGHWSPENCQYCERPVYFYILKKADEPDSEVIYHKCHHASVPAPAGNDMNCNELQYCSVMKYFSTFGVSLR